MQPHRLFTEFKEQPRSRLLDLVPMSIESAQWYVDKTAPPASGHWHVQCIDAECKQAEHGVFADEGVA